MVPQAGQWDASGHLEAKSATSGDLPNVHEVLRLLEAATTPPQPIATVRVEPPRETAFPAPPSHRRRWIVIGGVVVLALVVSVVWLTNRGKAARVERNVVAVAPFRVSAADSSLAYLREGMVDLLAAKLSGTAELRPTDPRTLLSAWRRAAGGERDLPETRAVEVAARVGAGRLVEGEVVGSGRRLSVSARILAAPGGAVRARVVVEGIADSLTQLVDRLAASLLALGSGEGEQRLAGLTSTSLPALRAYLDGQALLRRGAFEDAKNRFEEALRLDSTFALAGLGVARAGEWTGIDFGPALAAAWRRRDRLSPRDRAHLEAYLPRFPGGFGRRDYIEASERFVQVAPDSPEAWYALGDVLFHLGPLVGVPDAHRRAAAAFDRSLALDSSYAPTLQHLTDIGAQLGDTARLRGGLELMLRVDSISGRAEANRWFVASLLGDTAGARRALATDSILYGGPWWVVISGLDLAVDLSGTESLFQREQAKSVTAEDRTAIETVWHQYELIRGQPSRGPALPSRGSGSERRGTLVLEALFGDGDSAEAAGSARELERGLGSPPVGRDIGAVLARYAVGQYGLAHHQPGLAHRAAADLRNARFPADSAWQGEPARHYALLLEAQLAAHTGASSADEALRQLDSMLANPLSSEFACSGNLISARLHEERGELPAALAAVRRRLFGNAFFPAYVRYLREEGRLAALTGDREGAAKAYRHYLLLREDPEARLRPQRDSVRAELDALLRESTDKP